MTDKEPTSGPETPAETGAADPAATVPHPSSDPPGSAEEAAAPATGALDGGTAEHAAGATGTETEAVGSPEHGEATTADVSADAPVAAPIPETGSDPHSHGGEIGPGAGALDAPPAEAPPADAPPADVPPVAGTDSGDGVAGAVEDDATAAVDRADASGLLRAERIRLTGEAGGALTLGVRTVLGKHIIRQFGADHNVWDAEQCVIERGEDGVWQISPREGTTNETLVNSEALTGPRPLHEGDVIAVGRAAKGIARLPLTVGPA